MKIDYRKLLDIFKDKYDENSHFNKHDYEIYKEYLYRFDKLIDDEIEFAKLSHKFEDSVNDAFSNRYCLALMFALEELGLLDAIESGRIEEKSLIRKSIEESKIMSYKDFQDVCMEESSENDIVNFHEYKGAYFVILRTEEECERLLRVLCKEYGFEGTCYKIIDPYNPNYKCYEIMCV